MPPFDPAIPLAYQLAVRAYGERPEVTAVDVGFVYDDGKRTPDIGVRVHLRGTLEKPAAALAAELRQRQPSVGGVTLAFMESLYRPHGAAGAQPVMPIAPPRRRVVNPLRPGVSLSHERLRGGTLGLIVFDAETGQPCALSNAHVLAGADAAFPGDAIIQPAREEGGRAPRNTIGTLLRTLDDTDGDAAIALLHNSRQLRREQWETNVLIAAPRQALIGERVEKSGARTGTTRGIVDGVGRYYLPSVRGSRTRGIDGFKIVTEKDGNPDGLELSGEGDSGSVWYAVTDTAGLGLHVAGELGADPRQEQAIACHLDRVLDRLDVTLTPPGRVGPPGGPRGPLFDAEHTRVAADAEPPPHDGEDIFPLRRPASADPHTLGAVRIAALARPLDRLLDDDDRILP